MYDRSIPIPTCHEFGEENDFTGSVAKKKLCSLKFVNFCTLLYIHCSMDMKEMLRPLKNASKLLKYCNKNSNITRTDVSVTVQNCMLTRQHGAMYTVYVSSALAPIKHCAVYTKKFSKIPLCLKYIILLLSVLTSLQCELEKLKTQP